MAELDRKQIAEIVRQMKLEEDQSKKFLNKPSNFNPEITNAPDRPDRVQYRPESGFNVAGGGSKNKDATVLGGRVGYKHPIDDKSSIEVGASGHYAKGKGWKDAGLDRADINYANQVTDNLRLRAALGAGRGGVDQGDVGAEYTFKKGGKVKVKPKVRGHGIEKKGKTKGRFV